MQESSNFDHGRRVAIASLGALCLAGAAPAFAQSYPARPVKIVISTGAGGVTDIVFRAVAEELGKKIGQAVVVENKPGANGLIAAQVVKSASPDGYTLYGGDLTKVSSVFLVNSLDATTELAPVSSILSGDFFIYAPAALNIRSMKELAAYAKTTPGGLRLATVASYLNMILTLVSKRAGFEFENIPYKTSGETILAMLNGDVNGTLNAGAGFAPQVTSGKLRVLGTLSSKRSSLFPDAPTLTEQGISVDLMFDFGLWAPQNTPQGVVTQLNAAIADVMKTPAIVERVRSLGMVPSPSSPAELVQRHRASDAINREAAALVAYKPQ
ncbi:tripartite tricarboxylate transporter substrate binding protein [Comamonadaceae bacterium G21597-S1]|nr:tripartite tricarboxylate transporter substrate binding protein [Comamonadaceae bacterium G21597-S1]